MPWEKYRTDSRLLPSPRCSTRGLRGYYRGMKSCRSGQPRQVLLPHGAAGGSREGYLCPRRNTGQPASGPTAPGLLKGTPVKPAETVLVVGAAGGMALLLAQLARAAGARVIGAARLA